jgi:hypothetical protein
MRVHNKEDEMGGMHIIRYPHVASTVPYHQAAGVVIGQLVRYKTICNNVSDFKTAVRHLAKRMLERGHNLSRFNTTWQKLLANYWDPADDDFIQRRVWFKRMTMDLSRPLAIQFYHSIITAE